MAPDFIIVRASPAEIDDFKTKHGFKPSSYRVKCRYCDKRLWGSGLGIGSHRRACKGDRAANGGTP